MQSKNANMSSQSAAAGVLLAAVVLAVAPAHGGARLHGRHRLTVEQAPQQIACTVLGCQPIPRACRPVPGRTPGGMPTGFDVIICPPGTWPLK
jgi:hypothetical protein